MNKYLIIIYFLVIPSFIFSQPRGGRDIPIEFHFKFYDKQGNIVNPENKSYEVKIDFESPSYNSSDSVKFFNGYFSCISFSGAMISLNFISEKDTMKIYTSISHDSIPFLKGNFLIPSEYAPIFSIIPHSDTKINKRNWENFKVRDFKETIFPDTLKKTDCQFWKDYKEKIPIEFTPSIYGLLYNPDFSPKIYAWDWHNLYVSADKGKNWEIILTLNEPYRTPIVSFKDKNTLMLFKTQKHQTPINKKPEVYFSKDGGLTWLVDSTYTKMGFYYAGFNNKKEGFAYAIQYFDNEPEFKTVFYVTNNQGKKWQKTSLHNERLYPQYIDYWKNDTIKVAYNLGIYTSIDGGKSWTIASNEFQYSNSIGENYPSFSGDGFIHNLEKIDKYHNITKLLTIKNDWYVYMTATKNIWCISGQGYTIISKDQGKSWNYYLDSTAGTRIFTIIDDKYIFNGSALFEIN